MAEDSTVDEVERRDFLLLATSAVGVAGTALAAWPFVHSMNPAADVLALSTTEIDLSPVAEGQSITVVWRGKPVFIRHRTKAEIKTAQSVKADQMSIHPELDNKRVQKPQWLVVVGICTHLGCIPLGQREGEPKGDFNGWFCPCHGSHYDISGRIREGPAPETLQVPPYKYLNDKTILIG